MSFEALQRLWSGFGGFGEALERLWWGSGEALGGSGEALAWLCMAQHRLWRGSVETLEKFWRACGEVVEKVRRVALGMVCRGSGEALEIARKGFAVVVHQALERL